MKVHALNLFTFSIGVALLASCASPQPSPGGTAEFERRVQAAQRSGKIQAQNIFVRYPDGTTRVITPNRIAGLSPDRQATLPK